MARSCEFLGPKDCGVLWGQIVVLKLCSLGVYDKSFTLFAQDMDIIVAYTDRLGDFQISIVKMSQLSPSWIFKSPTDVGDNLPKKSKVLVVDFSIKYLKMSD